MTKLQSCFSLIFVLTIPNPPGLSKISFPHRPNEGKKTEDDLRFTNSNPGLRKRTRRGIWDGTQLRNDYGMRGSR